MIRLAIAALAAIAACSPAAEPSEVRAPTLAATSHTLERPAYVVDTAGMLSEGYERRIAERLGDFDRRTRHQFVVVTVRTTNERDIADYARDLGNRWGIGRRGIDDGVILLYARDDRRVRLAIGDGLSAQLSDEAAAALIRTKVVPGIRDHDSNRGIEAGVDAILARLDP